MKKYLLSTIWVIIASFCGVCSLSADNNIQVADLDQARMNETIVYEAPVEEATLAVAEVVETVEVPAANEEVYYAPEIPADNIQIAGQTLEIVAVSDTAVDSGYHVNKYGNKFLYGHNSSAVFGGLAYLGNGDVFTVTEGGVTKTYQIQQMVTFEKNPSTATLQLNGAGNYMRSVANARFNSVDYDLSIMTCAGVSYGNDDASHRLVIFANQI